MFLSVKHFNKIVSRSNTDYYAFSLFGFSVHAPDGDKATEVIYGVPGLKSFTGNVFVIKYRTKKNIKISYALEALESKHNESYFGYSVSSGIFDFMKNGAHENKLLYLVAGPRARALMGEVVMLEIETKQNMTLRYTFTGPVFGEYFGYSIVADDFNNDGLTDIAISAPFHRSLTYNSGCVYVYLNRGNLKFDFQSDLPNGRIFGDNSRPGQFGCAMSKIGDINHDGFNGMK